MKKKLRKLLIAITILLLPFLFCSISLADSGFDTSYDSGSSSFDSSSSYSNSDRANSTLYNIQESLPFIVGIESFITIFYVGFVFVPIAEIIQEKKKKIKKSIVFTFLLFLRILLLIVLNHIWSFYYIIDFISLFIILFFIIVPFFMNQKKKEENIKNYTDISIENLQEVKKQLYENYVAIQIAWMDFDYATLKKLCTEELFYTYKTQLETLKLKKEQNIMKDFVYLDCKIFKESSINNLKTIDVMLKVKLKDYIINEKKEIIRGDQNKEITMTYLLNFVRRVDKKENKCPNCGATLKHSGSTICQYCNSPIHNINTSYELNTKKCIKQE